MIGFDVISDLCLTYDDAFSWEGKATSLYCIIAGNISNDTKTIRKTLRHLGQYYQGVFYCLGSLEYENCEEIQKRTDDIAKICGTERNVVLLHHHVVICESVAILAVNGWYGNTLPADPMTELKLEICRNEDIIYLKNSLDKLQRHLDIRKIVVVSNSVPNSKLYFGQQPEHAKNQLPVDTAVIADTEHKISHWVYGTYDKAVDITMNNVTYINNSCYKKQPYWPKRIEV